MAKITISQAIDYFLNDPYFYTVHALFIRDAIEQAIQDNGGRPFESLDALKQYVKENYI